MGPPRSGFRNIFLLDIDFQQNTCIDSLSVFVYYETIDVDKIFRVYYYESIKEELKRRLILEYRCDERLRTKTEESTRLTDTGLVVELEHLKIKTRLIDEKFPSVRGECEI